MSEVEAGRRVQGSGGPSSAAGTGAAVKVSIVVPVYNEEQNIDNLHKAICTALSKVEWPYEILYVDDGSSDGTPAKLRAIREKDPRARLIKFRRNFGQGAALSAGFERASGEIIVPLDADLQNDPEDIPRMVAKLDEGYDVVAGWRKNRQDPFLSRVLPSRIANWCIGKVTGVNLHDYGCTIKAYRSSEVKGMLFYSEMHRFILLPAIAAWHGAKLCEEVVNHRPRVFGTSKYGITKTFKVVLDLLTIKFIGGYGSRPIYVFGFLAMLNMIGGGIAGAATLYMKLFIHHAMVQNPLLLLTVMLMVLGALFLSLGLTTELVSRLYQQTNKREMYVVDEKIG